MSTPITISYFSTDNGGVDVHLAAAGTVMRLPLDHQQALMTAAQILHNAGVERFEFGDGQFREVPG